MSGEARRRRVAVITVPGVGDDAPGDTVDAVARALAALPDFDAAERHELVVAPRQEDRGEEGGEEEAPYRTVWSRLRPAGNGPEVDVYEMRWADLSRFPPGLLRFLYTLYALALQLATIGLEALHGLSSGSPKPKPRPKLTRAPRALLAGLSWLLAVPVLGLTALVVALALALWLAVTLEGQAALQGLALAGVAGGTLGLAWWGGRRLEEAGWVWMRAARYGPLVLAVAGIALVGVRAWAVDDSIRVGIANTALLASAYGLRPLWMALAALAGVTALALAGACALLSWRRRSRAPIRAAYTGLLSVALGPTGVVLVSAVLLASIGAVALETAQGDSWGDQKQRLLCLESPDAWDPDPCGQGHRPVPAPTEWALRLTRQSLAPLAPVGLGASGFVALALAAVLPALLGVGLKLVRPGRGRRPGEERATSVAEGRRFDVALRVLERGGPVALLLGILVAAVGTWLVWLRGFGVGASDAGMAAGGGALALSALLVVVRLLGVDPRRPLGETRGNLEKLRTGLDLAYDVATYLRISHDPRVGARVVAARERMLTRYRALLRHVAAGGADGRPYDALLIAAHSQGTVLSVAVLAGDPFRRPEARPLREVCPDIALPPRADLLTFGCPLRQLYERRLPGQFAWVRDPDERRERIGPVLTRWVNVFRSGDYVGRALWSDLPASERYDPSQNAFWRPGVALDVRERCLGDGTHTGYWGDPRLVAVLAEMVREAGGATSGSASGGI